MKAKKVIGYLLLAFMLVSVGFAIGRETAPVVTDVEQDLLRRSADGSGQNSKAVEQPQEQDAATATSDPDQVADNSADSAATLPAAIPSEEKIIVYYMHGIPCVTCTRIDSTAAAIVRDEFADQVKSGRMIYASLNYLEKQNEPLADKYKVGTNTVIVVRFLNGQEVQRVRLDRVMELAAQAPADLPGYIRQGIRSTLEGSNE